MRGLRRVRQPAWAMLDIYLPDRRRVARRLRRCSGSARRSASSPGCSASAAAFCMTPLLIFIGVPPAVAVATRPNQLVAASVSGVLGHWRRDNVDFKMGAVLLVGGFVGSALGVWLFSLLRRFGQIDLVISLLYVAVLGFARRADADRKHARHAAPRRPGARPAQAASAYLDARPAAQDALPQARSSISARCCRSASASSSASSRRSWASAAASSWCRR